MTEQPTDDTSFRKSVAARFVADMDRILGVKAAVVAPEERDLRTCPDEQYAETKAAVDAKLERLKAVAAELKPAPLSEAALRAMGRLTEPPAPPHPEGDPLPESPAWLGEVPMPEEVPLEAAE